MTNLSLSHSQCPVFMGLKGGFIFSELLTGLYVIIIYLSYFYYSLLKIHIFHQKASEKRMKEVEKKNINTMRRKIFILCLLYYIISLPIVFA